ncbi:MAG TPA: biopolymer transporter ExbD [Gemmataceae bacterium]|jgi:biopolymer transport protein ExbD|nr:biopolymer transporter ExbD [Gemmataceae bacterium]
MRKRSPGVDVALPITPMLDMSFQLLAFFILTFHPIPIEGQLAAQMPMSQANDPAKPVPIDDDTKDQYTIAVYSADGVISGLSLRGPTMVRDNISTLRELRDALDIIPRPGKIGPKLDVVVTIEASNDLTYARLVEVIDLCKKAGIESINLSPLRGGPAL